MTNNIKKLTITLTALLTATSAHAQVVTYNGTADIVTDYVFRGISQSDESMAIQGSFAFEHESGVHGSIWGSAIDFNNANAGNSEFDLTLGYASNFSKFDLGYDLGIIHYTYPGSSNSLNYDYTEAYFAVSKEYNQYSFGLGFNYSPEYFGKSGDFYYVSASSSVQLSEKLSADVHLGYSDIDNEAAWGTPDYLDWKVGASYQLDDRFSVGAAYYDTDLSSSECSDGCEGRVVFNLSASF